MRLRDLAERQLPTDDMRPEFMEHVISPLGHAVIAYTFDRITEPVLEEIDRPEISERIINQTRSRVTDFRTAGQPHVDFDPDNHALALMETVSAYLMQDAQSYKSVPRIWETMSWPQKIAAKRFTTISESGNPDAEFFGFSPNAGYQTVAQGLGIIARRHPELGLQSMDSAVERLEDASTPRILRGLAAGGNGFMDSFRHMNRSPDTKPWRDDNTKPVIDTSNGTPRPHPEVIKAALAHREYTRQLTTATGLGKSGLFAMGMRVSSGCPVRQMTFDNERPAQFGGQLHLNDRQMDLLLDEADPVAETNEHAEKGSSPYRIRRDGYAETCQFLAKCLSQLQQNL